MPVSPLSVTLARYTRSQAAIELLTERDRDRPYLLLNPHTPDDQWGALLAHPADRAKISNALPMDRLCSNDFRVMKVLDVRRWAGRTAALAAATPSPDLADELWKSDRLPGMTKPVWVRSAALGDLRLHRSTLRAAGRQPAALATLWMGDPDRYSDATIADTLTRSKLLQEIWATPQDPQIPLSWVLEQRPQLLDAFVASQATCARAIAARSRHLSRHQKEHLARDTQIDVALAAHANPWVGTVARNWTTSTDPEVLTAATKVICGANQRVPWLLAHLAANPALPPATREHAYQIALESPNADGRMNRALELFAEHGPVPPSRHVQLSRSVARNLTPMFVSRGLPVVKVLDDHFGESTAAWVFALELLDSDVVNDMTLEQFICLVTSATA